MFNIEAQILDMQDEAAIRYCVRGWCPLTVKSEIVISIPNFRNGPTNELLEIAAYFEEIQNSSKAQAVHSAKS